MLFWRESKGFPGPASSSPPAATRSKFLRSEIFAWWMILYLLHFVQFLDSLSPISVQHKADQWQAKTAFQPSVIVFPASCSDWKIIWPDLGVAFQLHLPSFF